jgi:hypothetical protein
MGMAWYFIIDEEDSAVDCIIQTIHLMSTVDRMEYPKTQTL